MSSLLPKVLEAGGTMSSSKDTMYNTFPVPYPISPHSPRRRCKTVTRWLYSLVFLLFMAAIALYSALTIWSLQILLPPYPTPRKSWAGLRNQTWGIGFDLSAGYATASIAFNNGTILPIASFGTAHDTTRATTRADSLVEYNDALFRLSLPETQHPSPPYYNRTAQWNDLGRQWRRWFAKKRALPPSKDVLGLFHAMLRLQTDGNAWLRSHGLEEMEVVFVTAPMLDALYMEDLLDAAEMHGLVLLTLPSYVHRSGDVGMWPVSEVNTAMAGLGLGLDGVFNPQSNVESRVGASWEPGEEEPWSENVFSVLFTGYALTAHVSPITFSPHFYAATGIVDFSLGLKEKTPENAAAYWWQVRLMLRVALSSYQNRGHELGRVVVHGDQARNREFIGVLVEEVERAQKDGKGERIVWFIGDGYAASRGAAVFANWCQRGLGRGDERGCFVDLTPRAQGW